MDKKSEYVQDLFEENFFGELFNYLTNKITAEFEYKKYKNTIKPILTKHLEGETCPCSDCKVFDVVITIPTSGLKLSFEEYLKTIYQFPRYGELVIKQFQINEILNNNKDGYSIKGLDNILGIGFGFNNTYFENTIKELFKFVQSMEITKFTEIFNKGFKNSNIYKQYNKEDSIRYEVLLYILKIIINLTEFIKKQLLHDIDTIVQSYYKYDLPYILYGKNETTKNDERNFTIQTIKKEKSDFIKKNLDKFDSKKSSREEIILEAKNQYDSVLKSFQKIKKFYTEGQEESASYYLNEIDEDLYYYFTEFGEEEGEPIQFFNKDEFLKALKQYPSDFAAQYVINTNSSLSELDKKIDDIGSLRNAFTKINAIEESIPFEKSKDNGFSPELNKIIHINKLYGQYRLIDWAKEPKKNDSHDFCEAEKEEIKLRLEEIRPILEEKSNLIAEINSLIVSL